MVWEIHGLFSLLSETNLDFNGKHSLYNIVILRRNKLKLMLTSCEEKRLFQFTLSSLCVKSCIFLWVILLNSILFNLWLFAGIAMFKKIGKWSDIGKCIIPEVILFVKFVYIWSRSDGSPKFSLSGNRVGLAICGMKFSDWRFARKLFVGAWVVCSSKFMLKSPIRMVLRFFALLRRSEFRITVNSSTATCLLLGLYIAQIWNLFEFVVILSVLISMSSFII